MAPRKSVKNKVAKLVTGNKVPCGFCQREVDDELTYGKLYAIGDIQCHYFCVLLSSCLIQKGKDEDGLFGFLYEDIVAEIERAKKHRCSYCSRGGANLGCSISQCRKQFHLPCGRERNAVSLFCGNYKSFCQLHAPKQKIPPAIMAKAKLRMACDGKTKKKDLNFKDLKELSSSFNGDEATQMDAQSVCVICYEAVDGYPTTNTFWPPCCARDAWFHRSCLQRMALSAGMHYLKCPLCNDKENFYEAVVTQGYYVPDRDAAWELEQNAFAEIYEREVSCSAAECLCPMGRNHDADQGSWSMKLCLLCGSSGAHAQCTSDASDLHVCGVCTPAAPEHLDQLASSIEAVISQERVQSSSRSRRGPVMPARMSLRRTKVHSVASSSSTTHVTIKSEVQSQDAITASSRDELNLKTPKKKNTDCDIPKNIEYKTKLSDYSLSPSKMMDLKTLSPTKILEESLKNKMEREVIIDEDLVLELRRRFRKPKPLSEKRKIVNDILSGIFDNLLKEPKQKEPVRRLCSPIKSDVIAIENSPPQVKTEKLSPIKSIKEEKDVTPFTTPRKAGHPAPDSIYPMFMSPKKLKTVDILKDSSLEISAKDEIINIDVIKLDNSKNEHFLKCLQLVSPQKSNECAFNFSPFNKDILDTGNINHMDLESFKDQYLNEVGLQRVKKTQTMETPIRNHKQNLDEKILEYKKSSKKSKKKQKKISIKDKNIRVKIKWRKERLRLKITDSKKKKKSKKYQQYILRYSPETSSKLCKPKFDVTPLKRKYKKPEKTPDHLVQTSIESFFKVKSPTQ